MNQSDDDDPFTRALRLDLPEAKDEARVRARLVSTGVLAGAVIAPGAAAAAAAAGGGLAAKLAALPLALKVGASLVVLGVAAVPVWKHVAVAQHVAAPTSVAVQSTSKATQAPRAVAARVGGSKTLGEPPIVPAKTAEAATPVPPPGTLRVSAPTARAPEKTPPQAAPASTLPAVASFTDDAPAPLDEGSLRAETALMERALGALKRGDLTTARRELTEHQARFPNGHLVRERERALDRLLGKESEHDSK